MDYLRIAAALAMIPPIPIAIGFGLLMATKRPATIIAKVIAGVFMVLLFAVAVRD